MRADDVVIVLVVVCLGDEDVCGGGYDWKVLRAPLELWTSRPEQSMVGKGNSLCRSVEMYKLCTTVRQFDLFSGAITDACPATSLSGHVASRLRH